MLTSAIKNGNLDNPPAIMSGSSTGHYILIFGGATQTGKSTRADYLVAREEHDFVYGPKGKIRPRGVKKEGDNKRPDSIPLTPQKLQTLHEQGFVLSGAEYSHGNTQYIPLMVFPEKGYSAIPENHHVIYVSLTHEGAMRTKEALVEYNPLTFLLYTRLETLRKRLDVSRMSETEKATRLREYTNDFAQFRVRTDDYLFLFHVKSPPIPEDLYLDESAKLRASSEVRKDSDSIVELISKCTKLIQASMTYSDVHRAYVEEQVKALFGVNLDNFSRILNSGTEIKLDVARQMQAHINSGNFLSDPEKDYLLNLRPLGLITANGRHTLLIQGFGDPYHTNDHMPLENILMQFVTLKLNEEPTVLESVRDQDPSTESNLGLVKVVNDALLKDGLTYSLGNTHLVDNTHPSLNLVFVYPQKDGMQVADLRRAVVGMDSLEVKNLEDRTIQ
jgi:hypothetical protein